MTNATKREYFNEWEASQYAVKERYADGGRWREWLDLIDASRCPTCSVLMWVPFDYAHNCYRVERATVTHELGCPVA